MKKIFLVLIVGIMTGCGTRLQIPSLLNTADPQLEWARVLKEHVNDLGQVDFKALKADSTQLDAYVAYATQNNPLATPEAFSSKEEILASYINLYNALAMYNAVHSKAVPKQKVKFFVLTSFLLGEKKLSLYSFENKIIRPLNEPRIHFALNCMVVGCPRLPRVPFDAENLEDQLETATRLFFSEERNLKRDDENKVVYVSRIIKFYKKDYLIEHPTILAYINSYVEKKIPADYEIKYLPYDWSLNQS